MVSGRKEVCGRKGVIRNEEGGLLCEGGEMRREVLEGRRDR